MPKISRFKSLAISVMVWSVGGSAIGVTPLARAAAQEAAPSQHAAALAKHHPDLSGHKRVGKASF